MHEEQCSFRKERSLILFLFIVKVFFFLFARTRFSRVNGKRCTVIHRFKVEVGKFYNFTSLSEIIEVLMEM